MKRVCILQFLSWNCKFSQLANYTAKSFSCFIALWKHTCKSIKTYVLSKWFYRISFITLKHKKYWYFFFNSKIGYMQEVEITPGVKTKMKTLSMRPLVFGNSMLTVHNFMHCTTIIQYLQVKTTHALNRLYSPSVNSNQIYENSIFKLYSYKHLLWFLFFSI